MTKSRNINRPKKQWQLIEDVILMACYPFSSAAALAKALDTTKSAIYQRSNRLNLSKSDWFKDSILASRLRREDHPGVAYRFKKGHVPANKGIKGVSYPGMKATQFKPGHLSGRAALNKKPVGFERTSKDGYLERKINDDLPFNKRWRAVHIIEWEKVNGPLPEGHALVFINKDKTDIRLDNLELVTRAELMRRNTYHNYGKEIAQVIQLKGQITRQINKRERNQE
jgi:hypothetical protein